MSLKQVIKGDTQPVHIVVAQKALDAHKVKYGDGNKYHHILYQIKYRNKHYRVEVVTRKTTMTATVITGARNLARIVEVA